MEQLIRSSLNTAVCRLKGKKREFNQPSRRSDVEDWIYILVDISIMRQVTILLAKALGKCDLLQ